MTRIAFAWVFFIPERQVFMNNLWYVLLLGVVLALDAVTVSITNGIVESKMRLTKVFLIALFYAFFQFLMPVIGYYASGFLESFIRDWAHWVSFSFLLIVGGKMILDSVKEMRGEGEEREEHGETLTLGKLTMQAIATSIDALAIGITMLACEAQGELYANVWIDSLVIGAVTFLLCFFAVLLGRAAGGKIKVPSAAQLIGGIVLVLLGLKILLQGLKVLPQGF